MESMLHDIWKYGGCNHCYNYYNDNNRNDFAYFFIIKIHIDSPQLIFQMRIKTQVNFSYLFYTLCNTFASGTVHIWALSRYRLHDQK